MATQGGDDGGVGGGGLVQVPPAAGPGLVGDPPAAAAAPAPAPAVHEEEAEAEEDPAAVAAAAAAAAAVVAVPPQEKGHFVSVISRYIREKQYIHLEYFLKSFVQNLYYEKTVDLEHVQLVLGSRMANAANIAKVEGYGRALDYFESQIRPLMASESPYANHGNKELMINKIESALREKRPLLFDTEALKTLMCDYIRFNFPRQVGYPASEGRRSKLYEFVFPVADKRYRCLLCQRVWSSRPNSFLEKHFKGKEPCTSQTDLSKERYNDITNVKEKRKADSSVSTNLKLKEIKLLEQIEEDQEMENETEKPDMHQLISQGRQCIHKLVGPFTNNDNDAFMQVQNEMRHIFASMEKIWTSQSSQLTVAAKYPDPQGSVTQWDAYAIQQNELHEFSKKGSHFSRDTRMYTGPRPSSQYETFSENNQFSHMPANWDPAQQIVWDDYVAEVDLMPSNQNVNTGSHVSQDVPVHTEPDDEAMWDEVDRMIWDDDWFPDDGILSRNQDAITAAEAAPGDGAAATAAEELPVHVGATQPMHDGVDELHLYGEEPRAAYGEEAQTSPSRGRDGRRAAA